MFFLGISAHLFIYLLVPAFLIVCFYFKGIQGSSEIVNIVPKEISYVHLQVHSSSANYNYSVSKYREIRHAGQTFPRELLLFVPLVTLLPLIYVSPDLTSQALRAPPVKSL